MTEDIEREQDLFDAAREIPDPARRGAFLAEACGGDTDLLRKVEKLLSASERAERFFAGCAPTEATISAALEAGVLGVEDGVVLAPGGRIGTYNLLQKLGEGGCGVVFMAEQVEPVRRRVALKVIKLGMDTKSVIARFEAERQALAMMDHPNIARVLDAGATENGRPYFVMELVSGVRVTEYCDQNRLGLEQRLDLFIQICHAIQHAHQKGIIHRDIKPSNILVTTHDGKPVPKVIDFGIAKATGEQIAEVTLLTANAQLIGTPAYMSPEQAQLSGLDLDTRSDIYSLGVLLYELLTGRTPFDTKELLKLGVDEMRRTLRERDPCSPSAKLQTLNGNDLTKTAIQRRTEAPRLAGKLRGDLDWIVMKALEKDRTRRYETADALGTDVQRYLDDEPILARPPSRWYQLQKLVRRNQLLFVSGAAVAAALIAGTITSTCLFLKERAAERQEAAMRRADEAREKVTQAALLAGQGQDADAEKMIGGIVLDKPSMDAALLLRSLGEWHALNQQWPEARERFWALLNVDQLDSQDHISQDYTRLAAVLAESGDLSGYERYRQVVLQRFRGSTDRSMDRFSKCNLLLPADPAMMKDLQPFAEAVGKALEYYENTPHPEVRAASSDALSLGLIEYRRGNYAKAVDWSTQCLKCPARNDAMFAAAHIIKAMSLWHLNQRAAAVSDWLPGDAMIQVRFSSGLHVGDAIDGYWYDWVIARILSRESEALFRQAGQSAADLARLGPGKDNAATCRVLAAWHGLHGEWQQAADFYSAAMKLDRFDRWQDISVDELACAITLGQAGDTAGYEHFRQEEVAAFKPSKNMTVNEMVIRSCLILPADDKLLAGLAPTAAAAVAPFPDNWNTKVLSFYDASRSVSMGLLEYRRGNFAEAATWCRRCLQEPENIWQCTATARAILAMSLHKLGQDDDARSALKQSRDSVNAAFAAPMDISGTAERGYWYDWVLARMFLREATAMLPDPPAKPDPAQSTPLPKSAPIN